MVTIYESEDSCAAIENFNIVFYIRYDFFLDFSCRITNEK